jgi:hypothetical protein
MKRIEDFKTLLRRRKTERSEREDFEEDEEDQHPGKVSLNDGEHGKTSSINKKIINGVFICGALVLAVAFYSHMDNGSQDKNRTSKLRPSRFRGHEIGQKKRLKYRIA